MGIIFVIFLIIFLPILFRFLFYHWIYNSLYKKSLMFGLSEKEAKECADNCFLAYKL
jgi:hypothetical protein